MTAAKDQEAERSRRAFKARSCASKPGASSLHSFDMEQRLALELDGGGEPELGLDVLAVGADGLGAQAQLGGDLARAAAGPDQEAASRDWTDRNSARSARRESGERERGRSCGG
jgi:hypothetical protein